jgi:hypothetical protein
MLDVGSSYGWYTKIAANLMDPQTLKIALEANPEVAACLGRSLSGTVGVPTPVEGLPVDDVWPADEPLDFVKCDLEGGELDMLRGARRIRKEYRAVWRALPNATFGDLAISECLSRFTCPCCEAAR